MDSIVVRDTTIHRDIEPRECNGENGCALHFINNNCPYLGVDKLK